MKETIKFKTKLLFEHLYILLLSGMIYYTWLYKNISGYTYNESIFFLGVLCFICISISIYFTPNNDSTDTITVFLNVLLPFEIYISVSYYSYYKSEINIECILLFCVLFIYTLAYIIKWVKHKKSTGILNNIKKYLFVSHRISLICLMFVVLTLCFRVVVFKQVLIFDSYIECNAAHSNTRENMYENSETISKLDKETFKNLSVKEKMEVLCVVAETEAEYLGIDREISIGLGSLEEITCGQFVPNTEKITIDSDYIESASVEDLVSTIIHEIRHFYQKRVAEVYEKIDESDRNLLLFQDAEAFRYNMTNYSEKGAEYIIQPLESDANNYAYKTVDVYLSFAESLNN